MEAELFSANLQLSCSRALGWDKTRQDVMTVFLFSFPPVSVTLPSVWIHNTYGTQCCAAVTPPFLVANAAVSVVGSLLEGAAHIACKSCELCVQQHPRASQAKEMSRAIADINPRARHKHPSCCSEGACIWQIPKGGFVASVVLTRVGFWLPCLPTLVN